MSATRGVMLATYVDEAFGGCSDMEILKWLQAGIVEKFPIEMQFTWEPMLGFGCDVDDEEGTVDFHGKKYIQGLVDKFLPGESEPNLESAAQESIWICLLSHCGRWALQRTRR